MIYTGTFKDYNGKDIHLLICPESDRRYITDTTSEYSSTIKEIGKDENSDLHFVYDSPIQIETNNDKEFNSLICKDSVINILSSYYIGTDLYSSKVNSACCLIYHEENSVLKYDFSGFITPNTYNQKYANIYDSFEINCIDLVTSLQYFDYSCNSEKSDVVSFQNLIIRGINKVSSLWNNFIPNSKSYNFDINTANICSDIYVITNTLSENGNKPVEWKISENNFFDDNDDKTPWKWSEVLEHILKFCNLNIIQEGNKIYIFNFDYVRQTSISDITDTYHYTLTGSSFTETYTKMTTAELQELKKSVVITNENYSTDDTNISVDNTYNQISVKVNSFAIKNTIPEILDDTDLSTNQTRPYVLHVFIDNNQDDSKNDSSTFYNWIAYKNKNFKQYWYTDSSFWNPISDASLKESYETYCKFISVDTLPDGELYYGLGQFTTAQVVKVGTYKTTRGNDEPQSSITYKNCIYIPIHNVLEYPDGKTPLDYPLLEYTGGESGNYSPNSTSYKNYIVISGDLTMSPVNMTDRSLVIARADQDMYGFDIFYNNNVPDYKYINDTLTFAMFKKYNDYGMLIPSRQEPIRKWNSTICPENNLDNTTDKICALNNIGYDSNLNFTETLNPSIPTFINKDNIKYTATSTTTWGDNNDIIYRIPVIAAKLKIGNKWWSWDESTDKCSWSETEGWFPISVNPAIDDNIIGKSFHLKQEVTPDLGINASGMLIPITKADNINGKVEFQLLSPLCSEWNTITHKHSTFFRHSKNYNNIYYLPAYIQSYILKDFNIEFYESSNSLNKDTEKDKVYKRVIEEDYVNEFSDEEFKVNSAFDNKLSYSFVFDTDGNNVINVTDRLNNKQQRPEEHWIEYRINQHKEPKIKLQTTLSDIDFGAASTINISSLNKNFRVLDCTKYVREDKSDFTLLEVP